MPHPRTRPIPSTLAFAVMLALAPSAHVGQEPARETVLDRKSHIEHTVVEMPSVERLDSAIESRRVDLGDGASLRCWIEGEGTPIVLLHGGPGATHHYFHPHFSRSKQFARVVYYDQRGCGLSDHAKGAGYSIAQAVADLDRLRQELSIDRWIVLGHSYGGLLAQCYAVQNPDRLLGLVLVGASPASPTSLQPTRQYDYLSKDELRRIREVYSDPKLTTAAKLFNAHWNGDWKRQNYYRPSQEQLARMALYEWHHDPEFRARCGADAARIDLTGAFTTCPIPTLILEGKWDLTWNTDKPEVMQKLHPNARLVAFERSSHNPFQDEPEAFFDVLREFVTKAATAVVDTSAWKKHLAEWTRAQALLPHNILRNAGYGREASRNITAHYQTDWLQTLVDPSLLMRLGFALYDEKKYDDALAAFLAAEDKAAARAPKSGTVLFARIWRAHMLDLLGRRDDALAIYKEIKAANRADRFECGQYGLVIALGDYASERVEKPFERIENRDKD